MEQMRMAKTVNATLYFSELEWQIVTALSIDIIDVCRTAIKEEIRDRAEVREIVNTSKSIVSENQRLREENGKLREQLLTTPPTQPERMAILSRFGYR
jgi:post-segregation antitoxin (ccd killing protein)